MATTDTALSATTTRPDFLTGSLQRVIDPRLVIQPGAVRSLAAGSLAALRDSIRQWNAAAAAARSWTVGAGDARFGVSTGALHLGRLVVPAPLFISLHDADPRVRAQQSMLSEVREHAERRWRDSVVAAPRRP